MNIHCGGSTASPNAFRDEFGELTEDERAKVRPILLSFITALREILKRGGTVRLLQIGFKPPCHTCAMNPSTDDWSGFIPTVFGVVHSIRARKAFMCHENDPGWKENRVDPELLDACGGVGAAQAINEPACVALAERAYRELREVLGDNRTTFYFGGRT